MGTPKSSGSVHELCCHRAWLEANRVVLISCFSDCYTGTVQLMCLQQPQRYRPCSLLVTWNPVRVCSFFSKKKSTQCNARYICFQWAVHRKSTFFPFPIGNWNTAHMEFRIRFWMFMSFHFSVGTFVCPPCSEINMFSAVIQVFLWAVWHLSDHKQVFRE